MSGSPPHKKQRSEPPSSSWNEDLQNELSGILKLVDSTAADTIKTARRWIIKRLEHSKYIIKAIYGYIKETQGKRVDFIYLLNDILKYFLARPADHSDLFLAEIQRAMSGILKRAYGDADSSEKEMIRKTVQGWGVVKEKYKKSALPTEFVNKQLAKLSKLSSVKHEQIKQEPQVKKEEPKVKSESESPKEKSKSESVSPKTKSKSESVSPKEKSKSESESPKERSKSESTSPRERSKSGSESPKERSKSKSESPETEVKRMRSQLDRYRPLSVGGWLCKRKDPGRLGQPTRLLVNSFRLNFEAKYIYRYLVKFKPSIAPEEGRLRQTTIRRKFARSLYEKLKWWADAGDALLSMTQLDHKPGKKQCILELSYTDKEGKNEQWLQLWGYKSEGYGPKKIKCPDFNDPNAQVDGDNAEYQMVVNIFAKGFLKDLDLMQWGSKYYYKQETRLQAVNLSIFSGFDATVMNNTGGLHLCVDLSSRVMMNLTVRQVINDIKQEIENRHYNASQPEKEQKYQAAVLARLRGACVLSVSTHKLWRIDDVDFTSSALTTFDSRGEKQTYQSYMQTKYPNLPKLRNPAAPGMLVHIKQFKGKKQGQTLLIPDYMHLTGVTDAMKSNPQVMKALSMKTRLPPGERVRQISRLMGRIIQDQSQNQEQKRREAIKKEESSGKKRRPKMDNPLKMEQNPTRITGRIMPPFDIQFPNNRRHTLQDGRKDFSRDVRSVGFFSRPQIGNWAAVYPSCFERDARRFVDTFKRVAGMQKAQFMPARHVPVQGQGMMTGQRAFVPWKNALTQIIRQRPEVLLIFIPKGDAFIYSYVKHEACIENGIVTQCISTDTLSGGGGRGRRGPNPMAIAGNLFKQMMAKLKHCCWTVPLHRNAGNSRFGQSQSSTMLVGVDVSNDSQAKAAYAGDAGRRKSGTSTVAFVASYTQEYNQYHSYLEYQDKKAPMIMKAQHLMKTALLDYKKKNGNFPKVVIVFRDGVSDSQLDRYVVKEVNAYTQAFAELNIQPKITVMVCQKRVSHRFFMECPIYSRSGRCFEKIRRQPCTGREQWHSPMPGTVVDRVITSNQWYDFFLIPSKAPQGACARPTRFIVVRDDLQMGGDEIQAFVNQMCFMYQNWPGPIRVPSPIMYASKLCYLFAKHVNGRPHNDLNGNTFYL